MFADLFSRTQVPEAYKRETITKKIDIIDYIYLNKMENIKDTGSFLVIINTCKTKAIKSHPNGIFCISKSDINFSGEIKCLSFAKSPELNFTLEWNAFEYPRIVVKNMLKKSCEITVDVKII
jgi:hypothetical protein